MPANDPGLSARVTRLLDRLTQGQTRALARAIRAVDDGLDGNAELLQRAHSLARGARIVGITGTPGAGKSTLVDAMVHHVRAQGRTVAVLAVDPSSPFTQGAILGDRIRMQRHFLDGGVFIHSLATRGQLGGLSATAADALVLMDAAGFDLILVETVGVGQDELDVARHAHATVVVVAPGLGDDIQALKAGVLEIADLFVVNKADRPGADSTARDLQQVISRPTASLPHGGHGPEHRPTGSHGSEEGWTPLILKTVAHRDEGIEPLLEALERFHVHLSNTDDGAHRTRARVSHRLHALLLNSFSQEFQRRLDQHSSDLDHWVQRIVDGEADPYTARDQLLRRVMGPAVDHEGRSTGDGGDPD